MSDFINEMKQRGFIHQFTDEDGLQSLLKTPAQAAYIGFDCTAKSLHVGSLLQIMKLYWWQKYGHKPIVLLGGATSKIGDPSGKDESRPPLSDADIAANMASLQQVFAAFLKFGEGASDAQMVNNDDWLSKLNYMAFLRDYGRHFSVNRMMGMDSVKLRLSRDQHLSFLEFNYMIMQAYDFSELAKNHHCRVQMGGSDQWGNIVTGIELNRRLKGDEIYGITSPLITTASGAKMGKTATGAVWLNANMLSPYDYWQFWRNTEDADVARFLKFFTLLPMDEIAKLSALAGAEINEAKKILAFEATKMLHGEQAANEAASTAQAVFEKGGMGDDLPEIMLAQEALESGYLVSKLLLEIGFANSNGEARRLIKGGGVRLNDEKITDENQNIHSADFGADQEIKISAGKKRHGRIRLAS
jgi:tyrosyl-tRNA synthetase